MVKSGNQSINIIGRDNIVASGNSKITATGPQQRGWFLRFWEHMLKWLKRLWD